MQFVLLLKRGNKNKEQLFLHSCFIYKIKSLFLRQLKFNYEYLQKPFRGAICEPRNVV